MTDFDVLSVGRISVDLYANEPMAGFDQQQSFRKSVGGSPTNVAIASARLGHRSAIVTKVGNDAFGQYIRNRLHEWGVSTDFVRTLDGAQTPLAFAALTPPETPTVMFYRGNEAPDTTIHTHDVPQNIIRDTPILWISQTSLAQGATAQACLDWMALRNRHGHTILDLDYRPSLWSDSSAARAMATKAIALSNVVVGNREECSVALGTEDPDKAADLLLEAGVSLAIVKMGAEGSLMATPSERVRVKPVPVDVVCGLGAGDAFGGALCHGILNDWDLESMGRFASAAGAIVSSQLTCADAMPSVSEVTSLLQDAA